MQPNVYFNRRQLFALLRGSFGLSFTLGPSRKAVISTTQHDGKSAIVYESWKVEYCPGIPKVLPHYIAVSATGTRYIIHI